ncbi:MAG: hypothetical protein HYY17_05305 [Planctomycetes bacterium]|nr:hypothetical protein [Planctomycetota bacterium]
MAAVMPPVLTFALDLPAPIDPPRPKAEVASPDWSALMIPTAKPPFKIPIA